MHSLTNSLRADPPTHPLISHFKSNCLTCLESQQKETTRPPPHCYNICRTSKHTGGERERKSWIVCMTEGTLQKEVQKEEEEEGCGEEAKQQVQHIGITLRRLWRSNKQPSWFTVRTRGERGKSGGEREKTAEWGHEEGECAKDIKDEYEMLCRWKRAGWRAKWRAKGCEKNTFIWKKERTEGIKNNRECQGWYRLLI